VHVTVHRPRLRACRRVRGPARVPARGGARRRDPSRGGRPGIDHSVVRHLKFRYEVTNQTDRSLWSARFRAAVPVAETAVQRLLWVTVSHPATLAGDPRGNRAVAVDLGHIPPRGTVVVSVTAAVGLREAPARAAAPADNAWRGGEPGVEVDDAAIGALARQLVGRHRHETAEAAYRWVVANVRRDDYSARDRGAALTLRRRAGDCTDMAALFVALSRAAGVPARRMSGWVVEASGLLVPTATRLGGVLRRCDLASGRPAPPGLRGETRAPRRHARGRHGRGRRADRTRAVPAGHAGDDGRHAGSPAQPMTAGRDRRSTWTKGEGR